MNPIKYLKDWVGQSKARKYVATAILLAGAGGFMVFGQNDKADAAYQAAKEVNVVVSSTTIQ